MKGRLAEMRERMIRETEEFLNRNLRRQTAGHWPVEAPPSSLQMQSTSGRRGTEPAEGERRGR